MDREQLTQVEDVNIDPKKSAKIKFSETQWFMAATNAEELQESEPTDADERTAKFARDVSIPEEVRGQYSLKDDKQAVPRGTQEFAKAFGAGEPIATGPNVGLIVGIIALLLAAGAAVYFLFLRS